MLKFGNKDFRNLQEQVLKNMDDINFILQEEGVLNTFGIKVVGQEESIDDLPSVAEYKEDNPDWGYGDTYAIGTEAPYTLYVLTRANGTHSSDYWFNIGEFPVPGPQGPEGEPGVPVFPQISVAASATTLEPGQSAGAQVVKTGTDAQPRFTFTFEIPRGMQGIQGIQGPIGPQGPKGNTGYVSVLRQDAAHCSEIGDGYMDANGDLQLLTSLDPKTFTNCGQIRGPRGYTGATGDRGPTGYVNILRATAEDCLALGEGYMNSNGYLMLLTDLNPRTFTNCGQLRGPQGSSGPKGDTGYVNIIRPNAASCVNLYDAYVDSNGNLQILTTLPDTFTYGGRIKGDTGTAATITLGTVATGEPGTEVIITNSGSSSHAVFNFTIPQGMPGEDVGINPTIPAGAPTSSLVAIKSGNDYYTVPQGETSLVFNVSIPSGVEPTQVATIKDGSSYYTIPTKTSELTNDSGYLSSVGWNDITNKPVFSTVATSGSYNDLSNKPTIPTKTSDLQNDSGFSAVSGTNDGSNWTSLTINSITKAIGGGTGTANISFNPTVPSGITPTPLTTIEDLNTTTYYSISGGSGSGAAWGQITGTLSDQTDLNTALSGKQATLVSGTNIKTINNQSLLGSGNIDIQGGGGDESLKECHHTIEIEFEEVDGEETLTPTLTVEFVNYDETEINDINKLQLLSDNINFRKAHFALDIPEYSAHMEGYITDANYDEQNNEINISCNFLEQDAETGDYMESGQVLNIASSAIVDISDTVVSANASSVYMHQIEFDWLDGSGNPAQLSFLSTSNTAINSVSALMAETKVRKIAMSDENYGDGVLLYFAPDLVTPGLYLIYMATEDGCSYDWPKEDATVSDTVVEVIPNIKQEYIHSFKANMQGGENTVFTTYTFIESSLSTMGNFDYTSSLLNISMYVPENDEYGELVYAGSTGSVLGNSGYFNTVQIGYTDFLVDEAIIPTKPEVPSYTYSDIGKALVVAPSGLTWGNAGGGSGSILLSPTDMLDLLEEYHDIQNTHQLTNFNMNQEYCISFGPHINTGNVYFTDFMEQLRDDTSKMALYSMVANASMTQGGYGEMSINGYPLYAYEDGTYVYWYIVKSAYDPNQQTVINQKVEICRIPNSGSVAPSGPDVKTLRVIVHDYYEGE